MRGLLGPILIGSAGGCVAAFLIWLYAKRQLEASMNQGADQLAEQLGTGSSELRRQLAAGRRQLDQEIETQVRAQVPPVVRHEVQKTLSGYGLTPAVGAQITQVLDYAQRSGLLGVRRMRGQA